MIVSDQHRFIFVHIPKCAGTSVRRALEVYDDAHGKFDNRIVDVPGIGSVDVTHMPPGLLRRVEPEIFDKLTGPDYASYAVLRDPFERFPSSMAQRVKMFSGFEMAQVDNRTLRAEIDRTINHITRHPEDVSPDYIHLHRQSNYVRHDGRQVIKRLYTVEQFSLFMADVAERVGSEPPRVRRVNRTRTLKIPALRHPVRFASRTIRTVLPETMQTAILSRARRVLLKPTDAVRPEIFGAPEIRAFIAEHYADDIALYRAVSAGGVPAALPA